MYRLVLTTFSQTKLRATVRPNINIIKATKSSQGVWLGLLLELNYGSIQLVVPGHFWNIAGYCSTCESSPRNTVDDTFC